MHSRQRRRIRSTLCRTRLQSTETASSRRKSMMIGRSSAASSSPQTQTARSCRVSFGSSSPTSVQRLAVFYVVYTQRDPALQLPQLTPRDGPEPTPGLSRRSDSKLPLIRRKSSHLRSQRTELVWNRNSVCHRRDRLAYGFGAGDMMRRACGCVVRLRNCAAAAAQGLTRVLVDWQGQTRGIGETQPHDPRLLPSTQEPRALRLAAIASRTNKKTRTGIRSNVSYLP